MSFRNRGHGAGSAPHAPSTSMTSRLVPWMAMGLSMGVGYFGLELLLTWWRNSNRQKQITNSSTTTTRRRRHPLYTQLLRQVQQMETMMKFEHWFLQCWTMPVASYDLLCGVFVTALPASHVDADPAKGAARVLTTSSANNNTTSSDFLTLPRQLQARLPPKITNNSNGKQNNNGKKERYLELLLHNISHTDLVLGLESILVEDKQSTSCAGDTAATPSLLKSMCLGRPRFSAFDMYCRKMLQALEKQKNEAEIILVPQYQREQNDPRFTIQPSTDRPHVPTGFCWKKQQQQQQPKQSNDEKESTSHTKKERDENGKQKGNPRFIPLTEALADLRVRGKDIAKLDPCFENNNNSNNKVADDEATVSWNMVSSDGTEETTSTQPPVSREDVMVELKAVFFPLLATLLPRWHGQIAQKYQHHNHHNSKYQIQKVLVLVTGVGTPRNWTHSITGNSTQMLAHLMERFLAHIHPDITVVKIHSDTNIFRYDDNISFVQQELLPTVNAYRDAHATQAPYPHEVAASELEQNLLLPDDDDFSNSAAKHGYLQQLRPSTTRTSATPAQQRQPFDVDWKKSFAVTLSFADGSPARTHAIQTALRIYRPTYFHIWQLKTFWHERKIVDDDAEVHSFEEMETSPALESRDIREGDLAQVVQEMKAFREEMTETLLASSGNSSSNDLHSFWLRKTHKPVLAVLLVQTANGPPVLYRGTNMEVSMPTGSLCAERNVIGTALASNPKLKREDLKCIAVLAVPQPKTTGPAWPARPPRSASMGSGSDHNNNSNMLLCGSVRSSRQNSIDGGGANTAAGAAGAGTTNTSTMTGRQMRRQSFDEREEDWMLSGNGMADKNGDNNTKDNSGKQTIEIEIGNTVQDQQQQQQEDDDEDEPGTPLQQISLFKTESSNSLVDMIKQFPGSGGAGSPSSRHQAHAQAKDNRRTVLVRSNVHDMNPLRPCGACHEWLKKIAECNPYFQILTFTDADCNGVYVTPCHE